MGNLFPYQKGLFSLDKILNIGLNKNKQCKNNFCTADCSRILGDYVGYKN